MIPWALIDRATVPGGGELRLMQRDAEFSIMLGTIQLMSSRRAGSEEALATISCDRIRDHTQPHVLIGGLGMGFTLRAALTVLGPMPGSPSPNWCPQSSHGLVVRSPGYSRRPLKIRAWTFTRAMSEGSSAQAG